MHTIHQFSARIAATALRLAALVWLALAPLASQAATYYWDDNAAGADFGTAGASTGTWAAPTAGPTAGWSLSATGANAFAPFTTTTSDALNFGNGATGLGAGTITVSGSVSANSLTFASGSGAITLSGGTDITFGGTTPTITVNNAADTVSSVLAGTAGLVKTGSGTLTLNGSAVNTFTSGVTVNAGTLLLDFAGLSTPTDLINSGNAPSLGSGTLLIQGKSSGSTSQTLGNLTLTGGGQILVNPNGGTDTTLNLGTIPMSTANTSLLIGKASGAGTGTLTITTTSNKDATGIYGGRIVYTTDGGTTVDWATTASVSSPYTLSAYGGYVAMAAGASSDANNVRVQNAALTMTGAQTHNTLKMDINTTARILAIGGNSLTLTGGGLLGTGNALITISGSTGATRLTAGNGSGAYELVIHQYNTAGMTISAVIGDNGANPVSLVKSGTGVLTLSGANTYTGKTTVNAGVLSPGNNENRLSRQGKPGERGSGDDIASRRKLSESGLAG